MPDRKIHFTCRKHYNYHAALVYRKWSSWSFSNIRGSGSKQETALSHDVSDEKNKLLASKITKQNVRHSVGLSEC